jgi:hypothetical protein
MPTIILAILLSRNFFLKKLAAQLFTSQAITVLRINIASS